MKLHRNTTRFPIYRLIQTSALLSWLVLFPSSVVIAQEQSSAVKSALILYDENKDFSGLALLDRSLTSALRAGANSNLDIYTEFMDLSRFPLNEGTSGAMVDWRQLQRWGISEG